MDFVKTLLSLSLIVVLAGCKIIQTVPQGGQIVSRTGLHDCAEGATCTIDVEDGTRFADTFMAVPRSGYYFNRWKEARGYLCGGSTAPCALEGVPGSLTAYDVDLKLQPEFLPGTGPLRESDVGFRRHVEFAERISLLYPAHLQRFISDSPEILAIFSEKREGASDEVLETIALVKSSSPGLGVGPEGTAQLLSEAPYTIGGIQGSEAVYEVTLNSAPGVSLRAQYLSFPLNGNYYGLLHLAESAAFPRNRELVKRMADSLQIGQNVFEDMNLLSDLEEPGKPAIASDGENYLFATCRPKRGTGEASLFGRVLRSDRTFGPEFLIEENLQSYNNGCNLNDYQLVFDGNSYLFIYVNVVDGLRNVLMQRISRNGGLVGGPIRVSRNDSSQALSPAVAFDGERSLVAWYDYVSRGGRSSIMATFIEADGTLGAPFTIVENLRDSYNNLPYQAPIFRVKAASSDTGFLVVWEKDFSRGTQDSWGRPLYGQLLDFSGNKLSSEPLLIRADKGDNPRYVDVESDGDNFLVGWIEGTLETNSVYTGLSRVVARQVSATGQMLPGTGEDPFLVVSEQQDVQGTITGSPPRTFLDLSYDRGRYSFLWTDISFQVPAIWAADVAKDLSSVTDPYSVSGTASDGYGESLNRMRQSNLAYANGTGVVSWTDLSVQAWVFDRTVGIAGFAPSSEAPDSENIQVAPGSATLTASDLPRWYAGIDQAAYLGKAVAHALETYDLGSFLRDDVILRCEFGGDVSLGDTLAGGGARLDFNRCEPAPYLVITGPATVSRRAGSANYTDAKSVAVDDMLMVRWEFAHRFSGSLEIERSTLNLTPTRVRVNAQVSNTPGMNYRLRDLAFSVGQAGATGLQDIHSFSGSIETGGGVLNLASGDVGEPVLMRGARASAQFDLEAGYTQLDFAPADGVVTRSVRVSTGGIDSGDVELLANNAQPRLADQNERTALDVITAMRTLPTANPILAGGRRDLNVSGIITHDNGIPLSYELNVAAAEASSEYGVPTGEPLPNPGYTLSPVDHVTFVFSADDPGLYRLELVGIDGMGNRSAPYEFSVFVLGDHDGDGFADRDDFDDDNDGYFDSQDAFPRDPTEWQDTDGDGIGDNQENDTDNDGVDDPDDLYPTNPNCASEFDGDGETCYAESVAFTQTVAGGGYFFFFSYQETVIPVWDIEQGRFTQQLEVGTLEAGNVGPIVAQALPKQERIYLAYESGLITYFDFDDPETEKFFAQLPERPERLVDGVNVLLAIYRGRTDFQVNIYNRSGTLVSEVQEGFYFAGREDYVYSEAEGIFYDLFVEGDLDINTGEIIPEQEKLPDRPLASSPDGRYSVRARSFERLTVVDVSTGQVVAQLPFSSNYTRQVIWTDSGMVLTSNGRFYRLDERGQVLESYGFGTPGAPTLYEYDGKLFAKSGGSNASSPLRVQLVTISEDSDGDGVPNLQDRFPNDPEASTDEDLDGYPDAWNPGYTESGDSGLELDAYPGAVDCYMAAHGDGSSCDPASTITSLGVLSTAIEIGLDGLVYIRGGRGSGLVYRYSLEQERYLASLRVGSTNPYLREPESPGAMALSPDKSKLYLAYAGHDRRITRIDLSTPALEEVRFADLAVDPELLVATNDYVVVGVDQFRTVRYFYDLTGEFVQTSDEPRSADTMTWDSAKNKLYSATQFAGVYVESLDPAAFTGTASLLLDTGIGSRGVQVSPDGQQFVLGSDQIYNTTDGSVRATLPAASDYITRYLWLSDGRLARIIQRGPLQVFDSQYQLSFESTDWSDSAVAILEYNGSVVVVTRPSFSPLSFTRLPLP